MGAALGLGLEPGEVVGLDRHLGHGLRGDHGGLRRPPAARSPGFADATGRFLPLVCTINAGLVLDSVAGLLGADAAGLSARALAAAPGAGGITLLPYFDGERTPVQAATGTLHGLTTRNATPENLARAAVEAVLASLAEVAALLHTDGGQPGKVLLIGGGAKSEAVRAAAPGIFGTRVDVPEPEEYVALGAARQAAWALARHPGPAGLAPPPRPALRGPSPARHQGAVRRATGRHGRLGRRTPRNHELLTTAASRPRPAGADR